MKLSHLFGIFLVFESARSKELVLSTVIFRHGARAPIANFDPKNAELFSNGLGELTQSGIGTSVDLGRFLGRRYVDTGFLSTPFRPAEVFFRSLAINRCLITASAVGSGMFSRRNEGRDENVFVPVYSQLENETMLTYPWDKCTFEAARLRRYCKDVPPFSSFQTWPDFEGFVFECMGLHRNSSHFKNAVEFAKAEAMINEVQNGVQIPHYDEIKEELHEAYNKVFRFIIGVGEYHDVGLMRMKAGYLLHTVLHNLRIKWICHSNRQLTCKKIWRNRKFIAYSTQDWIVALLLEMFGVLDMAVGSAYPAYNSMIILELWDEDGAPNVKLLYKSGPSESMAHDLTSEMAGCQKGACRMTDWMAALLPYTTDDPLGACFSGDTNVTSTEAPATTEFPRSP